VNTSTSLQLLTDTKHRATSLRQQSYLSWQCSECVERFEQCAFLFKPLRDVSDDA